MTDVRTTLVIKDVRALAFIEKIREQYPSLPDALILTVMVKHGVANLEAMPREQLQEALLKG